MTASKIDTEGSDALIHLRVPAALKARWLAQSRQRGQKLTDWIIEKIEVPKMQVFKVPDALASKYHGSGYALPAPPTGAQIKAARLAANLTQAEAAELIGLHWQAISYAENGHRDLPLAAWAVFLLATGQHSGYRLTAL